MKNVLKKLFMFTSIMSLTVIMGGCSSNDSDKYKDVEYVQTHQKDDVTSVHAKMYQKNGNQDKMGSIKFSETDSGLKMVVDLKDTRPNTEYMVSVYEVSGCDMTKKEKLKTCVKTKQNIEFPTLKSDKSGKISATYMITGLAASDLDTDKIIISRYNDNGDMVNVGHGMLKHGMMF